MAHKAEKEETEFKTVPEPLTLCINCGVAGISAANICQVCFKSTATTSSLSSSAAVKLSEKTRRSVSIKSPAEVRSADLKALTTEDEGDDAIAPVAKKEVNRCSGCRKKVGLAGIRCRCGELFCSVHRYSDRHDCSYDYKTAGRETIARENPVVKGAKMFRI